MMAMFNLGSMPYPSLATTHPALVTYIDINDGNGFAQGFVSPTAAKLSIPWQLPIILNFAKQLRVTYSVVGPEGSLSGSAVLDRSDGATKLSRTRFSGFFGHSDITNWETGESGDPGYKTGEIHIQPGLYGQPVWRPSNGEWAVHGGILLQYNTTDYGDDPVAGGDDEYDDRTIREGEPGGTDLASSFVLRLGPHESTTNYDSDDGGGDLGGECLWSVESWLDWA